MSGTQWHDSEPSDDDLNHESISAARKRSSRACDQCRKTKSKCERLPGDAVQCKSCASTNTSCTFLGPSYKRGPPKGYIHAIEQRWHQVESLLGAILACPDPQVQAIISGLQEDDLAREIIHRVDMGPFGPSGRLNQPGGVTKEDFFASIIRSNEPSPAHRETLRSQRQSRLSHCTATISTPDAKLSIIPTMEWQDRLSSRLASSSSSPGLTSLPKTHDNMSSPNPVTYDMTGAPLMQRRRLDIGDGNSGPPEWKEMYTMDESDDYDVNKDTAEAIGQLSLDENKEVRFHGKASGLYILSRSDRTDDRREGGIWQLPMARVWPPSRCNMIHMYEEKDVVVQLPPIDVQNHLLELYFTHIHPIFPVVHKSHFLREYNKNKNLPQAQTDGLPPSSAPASPKPEPSQNVSKLLLLSIFAIAARFSEDEPQHLPQGKMWDIGCDYLNDARKILTKIFYRSRASTVQSLLILGHREFGIGSMEQAWIYIGMAIRMAIDLGLNQNSDKWQFQDADLFSAEEKQIRKQIWWACCLADKYGSIYMGRPISIRESDFDTPLPDVIQVEDDEPWQPIPPPSIKIDYPAVSGRVMSSFCAAAMLSVIVGSIISQIYPVRPATRISRLTARADLETRLDQWYIGLPENLRYDSASRRIVPPPQILFLHIRYWASVLLLYRAFIPNRKGEPTSGSTIQSDPASLKAFDLSQGAASHISAIVTAYHENFSLKRSSPFLSSYILSAGIMHVFTLTLRPSNLQASLGLRQCMSALKVMELVWPSAFRAWDLLNGVKIRFDSALTPLVQAPDRHKRQADDAFGKEGCLGYLQREAFGQSENDTSGAPNANGVQDLNTRMMAHMLGLDVPAIEPSASYYPGYEWWPLTNQSTSLPSVPFKFMPTSGEVYFDQPVDNWLQCNSETGPGNSYDLSSMANSFSF